MKIVERVVLVLVFFTFIGGAAWLYFAVQVKHNSVVDAVARGEYEIREEPVALPDADNQSEWRRYYPETLPILIGSTTVLASVADSLPERIAGLSNTPYLPENVVKLFAFASLGSHSIWMKDMKYALDIIWVAEDGSIVHIEEDVKPETYPESFASPTPAWYVIEANTGFVAKHGIKLGDEVVVTQ
jgi:uncharacterized membrane protein (UPF0127 family)